MEKSCNNMVSISGFLEKLEQQKDDIPFFRACISFAQAKYNYIYDKEIKKWEAILMHIMKLLAGNKEIGNERVLLASYAFFALHTKFYSLNGCNKLCIDILRTDSDVITLFSVEYHLEDTELFKLNIIYGYLATNPWDNDCATDLYKIMFNIIYRHCIKYTKYSYFAYKLLYKWLGQTVDLKFWSESSNDLERQIEAVIVSNWNNSISQITTQNLSIFNIYLKIMKKKYEGFLEFLFKHCVDNMSWQNEVKYVILSAICNSADNISNMLSKDFTLSLFTSLTKNNLRSPGTQLYIAIMRNVLEHEWKEIFGDAIKYVVTQWESGLNKNYDAIQLLCKHWLEPTIIHHKSILTFLWKLSQDLHGSFFHSHIHRMASELRIDIEESVVYYGNHENDIVRLNAFAADCYCVAKLLNAADDEPFVRQKEFLWHNANANSIVMRMGIIKYFRIFYTNLLRASETSDKNANQLGNFTTWMYEYFLDCFEMGSCYQRKILALNLYNIILSFSHVCDNNGKQGNSKEQIRYKAIIEKGLRKEGKWNFTDRKMLFALLKLTLDSEGDARTLSTNAIISYFHKNTLTRAEKLNIMEAALKNCNSSKFYEIESGTVLIEILSHWGFFDDEGIIGHDFPTYSEVLLDLAQQQFIFMKQDVLKATVNQKPFYGMLAALLKIAFRNGPESGLHRQNLGEKILPLLEDAVGFFLSLLSSHSTNTEYSSSFEEIGLAVNEMIKMSELKENSNIDELAISSAHQVLLSCIWMSLKISCELACEIGMLMHSKETVTSCLDLIASVLIRCRHKGAIEFSGTAMGKLTRILFNTEAYCDLPKKYVVDLLNCGDVDGGKHITRRGAGLTIMFHKLVASDNRKGRPLLHFVLNELLHSLERHTQLVDKKSIVARHLHFLCALVGDKELSCQAISYMEQISQMCFSFLQDQRWTVRNASLQLFGVVVRRLVGQTFAGKTLDFGNGYSVDHFITHYPKLATDIKKELERFSGDIYAHTLKHDVLISSNIVPVLTLLSKLSCGGCDLIDYSSENFIKDAKNNLCEILCNDVGHVRQLAAKAYAALTPFPQIISELEKLTTDILALKNINSLHGHLLAVHYLRKKLSFEGDNVNAKYKIECVIRNSQWNQFVGIPRLQLLSRYFSNIIHGKIERQPNYILETMFLEISNLSTILIDSPLIESIISQCSNAMPVERMKPGFFEFTDALIKLYIEQVKRTGTTNIELMKELIRSEHMSETLLTQLSTFEPLLETILTHISFKLDYSDEPLIESMISFAIDTFKESRVITYKNTNLEKIGNSIIKKIPYEITLIPLLRLRFILCVIFFTDETIDATLQSVFHLCFNIEERFRYIAGECIELSLKRLNELNTNNKLLIAHCCLTLLKDEVLEIRDSVAQYLRVTNILPFDAENMTTHNELIYQRLLWEVASGHSLFRQTSAVQNINFIRKFVDIMIGCKSANNVIENPFEDDNDTSYKEESKFLNIIFLGLDLRKMGNNCLTGSVDTIAIFNARYQLEEKIEFSDENLGAVLNLKYLDYLSKKQEVVLRECYLNV